MKVPKPTDADRERFTALVPVEPFVGVRPMFGNLGAFANGHMFMALLGSTVAIRLDEDDRAELAAQPGTAPFAPGGRPMREYVSLPPDWTADAAGAREWVQRSLAYVSSMPPKEPKEPKPRAPRSQRKGEPA